MLDRSVVGVIPCTIGLLSVTHRAYHFLVVDHILDNQQILKLTRSLPWT